MDDRPSPSHEVLEGMGVSLALLLVLFLAAFVVFDTWSDWGPNGPTSPWTNIPMVLLSFFGFTQSVYILPCFIFFRRQRTPKIAQGVLYGAALILAVNLLVYFWWTWG